MDQVAALLRLMREAAPPGQRELDDETRRELTELTAALVAARPESAAEFLRYLAVKRRSLELPLDDVRARLSGRTVVVTGGSGCLGTVLLDQLVGLGPSRLVSIGVTPPERCVAGVEYAHIDVRDAGALGRLLEETCPDVVFHLAAQRDPGLAEREVHRTISTNIIGTRNVVEAARRAGVGQLVYASTGKALRPYTGDVYAESKRVGEWVVANAATRGLLPCSGVRFTHVVDNSIVYRRLEEWCRTGGVVRLHSADIAFYAQSALESAQLMLCAALAPRDDVLRIHAIRDLGWPVNLLDLAVGMMSQCEMIAPIYIAGYDPGYEERPYPGLYDPVRAGGVSPLINAFEAPLVEPAPSSPTVDRFAVPAPDEPGIERRLRRLERLCYEPTHDGIVRAALDDLAWGLLDVVLKGTPSSVLRRVAAFTEPYRDGMSEEHLRLDDAVRHWAGIDGLALDLACADEPLPARVASPGGPRGGGARR
jgi:NAD(P)-dependent dehydrogenase (short-subunit alcohol dehydrogenase family)